MRSLLVFAALLISPCIFSQQVIEEQVLKEVVVSNKKRKPFLKLNFTDNQPDSVVTWASKDSLTVLYPLIFSSKKKVVKGLKVSFNYHLPENQQEQKDDIRVFVGYKIHDLNPENKFVADSFILESNKKQHQLYIPLAQPFKTDTPASIGLVLAFSSDINLYFEKGKIKSGTIYSAFTHKWHQDYPTPIVAEDYCLKWLFKLEVF